MRIIATDIPDCFEILPPVFADERGKFVKTFQRELFAEHGMAVDYAEEYYSSSHHGVLRGLHFQLPPHQHAKLVYCLSGEVIDAVLDLRVGSPAFGRHVTLSLSGEKANMLYIPPGLAHGFYVNGDHALMQYKVTSAYAPEYDTGILWSSAGIAWPETKPLVSVRDAGFITLERFESPFVFGECPV
ncbi:MAG: dTDP-4-dehydrorhamnose 3,5-epimerase [Geobacteraceae bacterium]|nr:dTDP-4-dehydrorhamnose 3,5-epimerase [Geobacteraceae bacterium]